MCWSDDLAEMLDNPRRISLLAGEFLLIGLALLMIFASGGVGTVALTLLPLLVGAWVVYGGTGARWLGVVCGLAYAIFVAVVVTAPLRGLTPPPGQSSEPVVPAGVVVALAFVIAALLIAYGRRGAREPLHS